MITFLIHWDAKNNQRNIDYNDYAQDYGEEYEEEYENYEEPAFLAQSSQDLEEENIKTNVRIP